MMLWRVRRALDAVGGVVWIVVGLVVVEALFYYGSIAPLTQRQGSLLDDALRHRQARAEAVRDTPAPHVLATDMAAFYKSLPRSTEAARMTRRLQEIAEDNGVWIDEAQYRPSRAGDGKLIEYQITLPAKGTYPELRQFLTRAIRDIPGLAVEGINFQRKKVGEAELDAELKLTLFLTAART